MTRKKGISRKGIFLDKFSEVDLRTWKKLADLERQYHVGLFYHLEGLRELKSAAIEESLLANGADSFAAEGWYRIVDFQYSLEALSCRGSLLSGGRFNIGHDLEPSRFPPFPALYLASSYETAYLEKFGAPSTPDPDRSKFTGAELALKKPPSFTAVKLRVHVNNIFDLRKTSNLNEFAAIVGEFKMTRELISLARTLGRKPPWLLRTASQIKESMLADNWRLYPVQFDIPSNPQVFGRVLKNAGFEGIVYPSAKNAEPCTAVFVENLDGSDSFVELIDAAPAANKHTRLDANNWRQLVSVR